MAQSAGVKRCGVAVYVGAWRVVEHPGIRNGRARTAPFGALLQLGLRISGIMIFVRKESVVAVKFVHICQYTLVARFAAPPHQVSVI